MSERATKTGVLAAIAACQSCDWTDERRGSLGRAALHHDRTGHEVHVETTTVVIYGDRAATLAEAGQATMDI